MCDDFGFVGDWQIVDHNLGLESLGLVETAGEVLSLTVVVAAAYIVDRLAGLAGLAGNDSDREDRNPWEQSSRLGLELDCTHQELEHYRIAVRGEPLVGVLDEALCWHDDHVPVIEAETGLDAVGKVEAEVGALRISSAVVAGDVTAAEPSTLAKNLFEDPYMSVQEKSAEGSLADLLEIVPYFLVKTNRPSIDLSVLISVPLFHSTS